jgi:hypothetical protein
MITAITWKGRGRLVFPLVFFPVLLPALIVCSAYGQTTRPATSGAEQMMSAATAQGRAVAQALVAKDYDKVADATFPAALQAAGGREHLIAATKQTFESSKIQITRAVISSPSQLVDTGSRLFAVLPETLDLGVRGNSLRSESFLLGISDDRGRTWRFVDGADGSVSISKLIPDMPATVILPARKKPVLIAGPAALPAPMATTVPTEIAGLQEAREKWLAGLKGKTEAEITRTLGNDCTRDTWNSGKYGGLVLKYKVGKSGTVTLLFNKDHVVVARMDIDLNRDDR